MVSAPLKNILATRRSLLNERVAEARRRLPGLNMAAFKTFVSDTLDAVCLAVDKVDAQATLSLVESAFEMGLDLVGLGFAGPAARQPWVDRAWQLLAGPMARLVAESPVDALGTITNAAIRLGAVQGVRVDAWIDAMALLAMRCRTMQELRAVGVACAWRAGMAHLRRAALEQAASLDPALAAAALGAPDVPFAVLHERLLSDRWWNPSGGALDAVGHIVGGFSGLGGPFVEPPDVRACADGFVVQSAERYFLVMADAFGAVVLPASEEEFAFAREGVGVKASVTPHGVRVQGREIAFAVPGDPVKAVVGADSMALFSPWTHMLRVVPVKS